MAARLPTSPSQKRARLKLPTLIGVRLARLAASALVPAKNPGSIRLRSCEAPRAQPLLHHGLWPESARKFMQDAPCNTRGYTELAHHEPDGPKKARQVAASQTVTLPGPGTSHSPYQISPSQDPKHYSQYRCCSMQDMSW